MPSKVDPAILKALSLDAASTSISSQGGGFSSTAKLTSVVDGKTKRFFVKTSQGRDAEAMFAGEHASLNAIHSTIPSLCPPSHAHGPLSSSQGSFLATSYINLSPSPSSSKSTSGLTLAQKLSILHTTPAPIPAGFSIPQFGFPLPTFCGSTYQDNTYTSSWSDFYANRRLLPILNLAEKNHGKNKELAELVSQTISTVIPTLLGGTHLRSGEDGQPIKPVLIHGDLWSGNRSKGIIEGGEEEAVEEIIYDPSSCYAHSEFEWGIMKMFGGFGGNFEKEYFEGKKKDEPRGEWGDRVELYELYHQLNHYAIFGGSYRSRAVGIMRRLLEKFGE